LSYELVPGDEDEERRTMREEMRGGTWIGTPRTIRMPYRDAYDNPVFLDIRRWIPAGDVFDTHQGQLGVPAPLQVGGPLMLGAELFLNKTAFTGDEIVNPLTDDWWDRSRKRGDWFWKAWMPSAAWIPGGWHNDSIVRAATGGLDSRGRPYSVTEAVLGAHGIKARGHDVDLGYRFRALEIERTRRGLENDGRTMSRNLERNLISRSQYDREMERIRRKIERLRSEADALRGRD
ncbi:MAG: hypothetical protein LAT50_02500, partial [Ectothiorhodospiraceae bacterium]|nr:hypothetical protein [Ectothiorhodospiraceae bacterium]